MASKAGEGERERPAEVDRLPGKQGLGRDQVEKDAGHHAGPRSDEMIGGEVRAGNDDIAPGQEPRGHPFQEHVAGAHGRDGANVHAIVDLKKPFAGVAAFAEHRRERGQRAVAAVSAIRMTPHGAIPSHDQVGVHQAAMTGESLGRAVLGAGAGNRIDRQPDGQQHFGPHLRQGGFELRRLASRAGTGEVGVEMDAACVGGVDPADEGREPRAVPGQRAELAEAAIVDRHQHGRSARGMAAELVAAGLKHVLERLADLDDAEDEPDQQRQQQRFPAESVWVGLSLHLNFVPRRGR